MRPPFRVLASLAEVHHLIPNFTMLSLRPSFTGFCLLVMLVAALSGCRAKPVVGGTPGQVQGSGELKGDIQVTLHRVEGASSSPVGFAVTAADGSFQLVTNGARGALWLTPGEYRCTLESAGTPVQIPADYTRPDSTPLKISWSQSDQKLDLKVSFPLAP